MDRKEKKDYKSPTLKTVTFKIELGIDLSTTAGDIVDDTPGLSDYVEEENTGNGGYFSW